MLGLSLVVASGGHSSSWCAGLSPSWPLLLRSTGSRRAGSVVVAHGPSCSAACGIFPDQGSNPCPLHQQADSQPLRHQGSPCYLFNVCGIYGCVSSFLKLIIIFLVTLASGLSTLLILSKNQHLVSLTLLFSFYFIDFCSLLFLCFCLLLF